MTTVLHRRLAAVEAKVAPKISQHELRLLDCPAFVRVIGERGVSVDDFKRNGLGALPRDLLRDMVDRLKVSMLTAG